MSLILIIMLLCCVPFLITIIAMFAAPYESEDKGGSHKKGHTD